MKTPHEVVMAWARSAGFATVHNTGATDEAIATDFLLFLELHGFALVEKRFIRDYHSAVVLRPGVLIQLSIIIGIVWGLVILAVVLATA